MAFFGRLGSILRQSANKQITSQLRSSPSVFQAIRCMSTTPTTKLFIGGVSYSTDEQSLREAFARYGEVVDARIISDRETGRSRGFGFVTFTSVEEASSAIQALDGQDLHGRVIRVNYANERPRQFGGGSFGGGGFGGGFGAAAGGGYGGSYGGGSSGGGGYGGNTEGGYGGGGYGGGSYGGGGYGGGSYGGSGGAGSNYTAPAPDSFGTNSASGSFGNDGNFTSGNSYAAGSGGGYGGNNVNFSDAGGVGNPDSSAGFDASGSGIGTGGNENAGGFGDSLGGNFRDDNDDTDNFAKRA